MRSGAYELRNNLFVAPMAGVTDRSFRKLCRRFGAGLAVSEMMASNAVLRGSEKTLRRGNHEGEPGPVSVQIAGGDPESMADAARYNVGRGAQIIDINMGCPAKKVCNKAAGSALLRDEMLVGRIVAAVVAAVDVPVTLKFRTGWDTTNRNAVRVAKIAEDAGAQLLSLHGRTRACGFSGQAEYDTIAEVKQSTRLPVIANGDIDSPQRARDVLRLTGADGIMIGRAAQGRPWIFREIEHFLATGEQLAPPLVAEIHEVLVQHLGDLYALYGSDTGVRVARKHIAWYTRGLAGAAAFRQTMNRLDRCDEQLAAVDGFFEQLARQADRLCYQEELAA